MSRSNPLHRECEIKLAADDVPVDEFVRWCFAKKPTRYMQGVGPDTYYGQGQNVVRHRKNGEGAGELTVKRRTSTRSTKDRLEIDLRFNDLTKVDDVERFLIATGWKPEFTVVKSFHIFWFEAEFPSLEVVLYDVRCTYPNGKSTPSRRFVEVEVSKKDSGHVRGFYALEDWEKQLREQFNIGATQSESLYEIYSGKRYGLVNKKMRYSRK
jgi:adenylate cyclase class IV